MIALTDHARKRLSKVCPEATDEDVDSAVLGGVEVSRELVATLTCSNSRCRRRDSIYIAADGWPGVFVLAADRPAVVTFLRFTPKQVGFLPVAPANAGPPEFDEPPPAGRGKMWKRWSCRKLRFERRRDGWGGPAPGSLWRVSAVSEAATPRVLVGDRSDAGLYRIYQVRARRFGGVALLPAPHRAKWRVAASVKAARLDWTWDECAMWLRELADTRIVEAV